jgi:hypothetical protein
VNARWLVLVGACAATISLTVSADGAWFGLPLPGPLSDPDKSVVAVGPAFETAAPQYPKPKDPHGVLSGAPLIADVHHIIQFSVESHLPEWARTRCRILGGFHWQRRSRD